MTLPQTRQRWEERKLLGMDFARPEAEVLEANANWLIERLYKPVESDNGWRSNRAAIKEEGIDFLAEHINWGDLSASVEWEDGKWIVILEEATEGQCPTLCAYIKKWLIAWGWENVEVVTEW